jgi:FKBP-type peptidyl-prolyl cis-trans isomerase FklB
MALRLVLILFVNFFYGILYSQTAKPKPAAKPATIKPLLKDLKDSASYTGGLFLINRYSQQGITNLNPSIVAKAINDLQAAKTPLLTNNDADNCVIAYQGQLRSGAKTASKPATPGKILKDTRDSASYAAGMYLINFFSSLDITGFNSAVVSRTITDLQAKKPRLLSDDQANNAILSYQYELQIKKAKPKIEEGEKMLAENKKRTGVTTTASGLQYEIITEGTGPLPEKTDVVNCNYIGKYIDGTEFENSYKSGQPVSFGVNGVIKGWTEALLMMPAGSKWKLYVPYYLGYGPGNYHAIPGGSLLIFEVELVSINGK